MGNLKTCGALVFCFNPTQWQLPFTGRFTDLTCPYSTCRYQTHSEQHITLHAAHNIWRLNSQNYKKSTVLTLRRVMTVSPQKSKVMDCVNFKFGIRSMSQEYIAIKIILIYQIYFQLWRRKVENRTLFHQKTANGGRRNARFSRQPMGLEEKVTGAHSSRDDELPRRSNQTIVLPILTEISPPQSTCPSPALPPPLGKRRVVAASRYRTPIENHVVYCNG